MTITDILTNIKENDSLIIAGLIILTSIIEVSKIKLNPWCTLFGWIGKITNKKLQEQVDAIKSTLDGVEAQHKQSIDNIITKVDNIEDKLDLHIEESVMKDVRDRRVAILDFANSCMNNKRHTQEEFEYVLSECDAYIKYCEDNNIINSVADNSIAEIKRVYRLCLQNNSFLKEGQVNTD